jgi:hypothetical protein
MRRQNEDRRYQGVPESAGEHYWHDAGVKGNWSIIKPYGQAIVNAATNPSFELFETGWFSINGATRQRDRDAALHGDVGSLVVTTSANQGIGYEMFPQFSFNTPYSACISVNGPAGAVVTFQFEYEAHPGALQKTTVPTIVTLSGYPIRICATLPPKGTDENLTLPTLPISLRFDRAGTYYVDGLVLTTTSEPITSYFDGDSPGAVWLGTPHASASSTDGFSRLFGERINFNEIGFNITGNIGFGLTPRQLLTTSYARLNGAHFQRSKDLPRVISLVGTFEGPTQKEMHESRRALVDAMIYRFKNQCTQELLLCYSLVDECGNQVSEELQIPVEYQAGLEGLWGSLDRERATLTFVANTEQSFASSFDSSTELNINGTIVETYEGTDDAWPDVHIFPGAGGLNLTAIHNDTTGHSVYFGTSAVFGQYAILRTNPAQRISLDLYDYTLSGVPIVTRIMHYIRYDISQVGLLRLVPGENQFRAPASLQSTGNRVFLRYRDRFLSVDHLCADGSVRV